MLTEKLDFCPLHAVLELFRNAIYRETHFLSPVLEKHRSIAFGPSPLLARRRHNRSHNLPKTSERGKRMDFEPAFTGRSMHRLPGRSRSACCEARGVIEPSTSITRAQLSAPRARRKTRTCNRSCVHRGRRTITGTTRRAWRLPSPRPGEIRKKLNFRYNLTVHVFLS